MNSFNLSNSLRVDILELLIFFSFYSLLNVRKGKKFSIEENRVLHWYNLSYSMYPVKLVYKMYF